MIVRARTEINEELLCGILGGEEYNLQVPEMCYFFNSGSASLRFFLRLIGPGRKVGVQVFTCSTVLDAIIQEDCDPVFLDINPCYYTTTIDYVKNAIGKIDILLLTHLYGIPNPDYISIKQLCYDHHVVLIDDLCHTFHSKIGDSLLEDLSDNYIYSFFYDKPISSISGGMLKLSNKYKDKADEMYRLLPILDIKNGRNHLRVLLMMHKLLSPDIYTKEFRNGNFWKWILEKWPMNWNIRNLNRLLHSKLIRILDKMIKTRKKDNISRMSDVEMSYVLSMMNTYQNNNQILLDVYRRNKKELPAYLTDSSIEVSVAKRAIVGSNVEANGVQIGLYNWPELICGKEDYHKYPNAVSVINTNINIPTWKEADIKFL